MLNKCPVSSYDQVCEVFKKELGETPDKVYILALWVSEDSCYSHKCRISIWSVSSQSTNPYM